MAKVNYGGVEYATTTDACKALGINQQSLSQVKKRWNKNTIQAIDYILANQKPRKSFEYDGVLYDSLADACRKNGLPVKSVYAWKSLNNQTATAAFEHYLYGYVRRYTKKE